MKYIDKILDKFTPKQRLIVLLLLLGTTVGMTALHISSKEDNCSVYKEELLILHQDLVNLSSHIREIRNRDIMVNKSMSLDEPRRDSITGLGKLEELTNKLVEKTKE